MLLLVLEVSWGALGSLASSLLLAASPETSSMIYLEMFRKNKERTRKQQRQDEKIDLDFYLDCLKG